MSRNDESSIVVYRGMCGEGEWEERAKRVPRFAGEDSGKRSEIGGGNLRLADLKVGQFC